MDEGRIAVVKRQEDQHRKFVCILNHIAKAREIEYQNCLTRDRYETSFRYFKNCMTVKQTLVRQKILQKCLTMRRRAANDDPSIQMFGQYGGMPIHGFTRYVEQYIVDMHPKVRRIRKVQRILRESKENGAILDKAAASEKIENFFSKQTDSVWNVIATKIDSKDEDVTVVQDKVSTVKHKRSHRSSAAKQQAGTSQGNITNESGIQMDKRATLVLPPISASKALVQQ